MGYKTISYKTEETNSLMMLIPYLKQNFNENRQWATRKKSSDDFEFIPDEHAFEETNIFHDGFDANNFSDDFGYWEEPKDSNLISHEDQVDEFTNFDFFKFNSVTFLLNFFYL
jgi:hypothetical protein